MYWSLSKFMTSLKELGSYALLSWSPRGTLGDLIRKNSGVAAMLSTASIPQAGGGWEALPFRRKSRAHPETGFLKEIREKQSFLKEIREKQSMGFQNTIEA